MTRFQLYVLRLQNRVWGAKPKFRSRNPDYEPGRPMVYVGSTAKTVEERIAVHLKDKLKGAAIVREYFKREMPFEREELRADTTRDEAESHEARKADELRARGWAVWQG
jgi:Uri superfamily endonuclease